MNDRTRSSTRRRSMLAIVAIIWFFVVCGIVAAVNALVGDQNDEPLQAVASPSPTRTAVNRTPTARAVANRTPTARPAAPRATPTGDLVQALVVKVVDGDTLDISIGGKTYPVRLIGINTPESGGPYRDPECFGSEASDKTTELVEAANQRVYLERDVSDTDQYGRLLRYVWMDEPSGTYLLNEELVQQGYARPYTFEPDVKYRDLFRQAERAARDSGAGLWSACPRT